MATKPLPSPLTADLPENWTYGQTVAPTGQEVGLPNNYGYNYLMAKVNEARTAINTINSAFTDLPDANTLGQYLKKTGGTMTGNITMSGGAKVTGVPDPTDAEDAVPKNYVDQQLSQGLAQYLKLTGGTMTGNVNMSGNRITGLNITPTQQSEAVCKKYVDGKYVIGTYIGNQEITEAPAQFIGLGFTPSCVILNSKEIYLSNTSDINTARTYFAIGFNGVPYSNVVITTGGFYVYNNTNESPFDRMVNVKDVTYGYIAFR